jgi:hypothetical protein
MKHKWFRPRGYKHFDVPVGMEFAEKVYSAEFVAKHAWSPLIQFIKRTKRYKPNLSDDGRVRVKGATVYKNRMIMFASHRDACILSKYADDISTRLNKHYVINGLENNVIAYRRLGRANYHFSSDAYNFAKAKGRCLVMCFDITGFFDNLDHFILKKRLKKILNVSELPKDWFSVFRHVTRFRYITRSALEDIAEFKLKFKTHVNEPIATLAEIKALSIPIIENLNKFGIPQGTPISAAFSNLYMLEVDRALVELCTSFGALYQRYSDDILIVCSPENASGIENCLKNVISEHKLQIKDEKTERAFWEPGSSDVFQYLGFNISQSGAVIRPASLARQWRKAKRAIKRTEDRGRSAIASGKAKIISTKRLRQLFWPTGARNFSKYARRAASEFHSKGIVRQVMRLERMVDKSIRKLKIVPK